MSNPRHKARRLATQALYTWQMSGGDLADIDQQYCMEHDMSKVDAAYFHELLHQVPAHIAELDAQITPLLDRPMEEVDPVERAVLRLSTYELLHRLDVPYRVVINEGIMLAKVFGASEGHKYVNSILDGVARQARSVEINAAKNTAKKSPTKKGSSKSATGK
jgi:N utilization substance protein B